MKNRPRKRIENKARFGCGSSVPLILIDILGRCDDEIMTKAPPQRLVLPFFLAYAGYHKMTTYANYYS